MFACVTILHSTFLYWDIISHVVYTSVHVTVYTAGPVQSGVVYFIHGSLYVLQHASRHFYDLKQCLPLSAEYLYFPSAVCMFLVIQVDI